MEGLKIGGRDKEVSGHKANRVGGIGPGHGIPGKQGSVVDGGVPADGPGGVAGNGAKPGGGRGKGHIIHMTRDRG